MQIRFKNVSYSPSRVSTDGVNTIEDVSFNIENAGLTGIMGTADSGRRTVLWLLAAILRPQKGHIFVNQEDIHGKKYRGSKDKPQCAFVLRDADILFYEKSVEREFELILKSRGLSAEEKNERMFSSLESLGLNVENIRDKAPASLSKSDRYKIALALALSAEPEILLLEEPVEQLDGAGRRYFRELCGKLKANGCHIVISTNDADFLAEYADHILVMQQGRLIRSGSARHVFADYYDLIRNNIPVPSVKKTIQRLHERNVNIPLNIVDYEQFIDRLKIIMWRKQR